MEQTTIVLDKETRDKLKALGQKGETYDAIVSELIELAKRNQFYQRQVNILKTERFVSLGKV
jgi:hypothetical protein